LTAGLVEGLIVPLTGTLASPCAAAREMKAAIWLRTVVPSGLNVPSVLPSVTPLCTRRSMNV
jgi:hypothetical protein